MYVMQHRKGVESGYTKIICWMNGLGIEAIGTKSMLVHGQRPTIDVEHHLPLGGPDALVEPKPHLPTAS